MRFGRHMVAPGLVALVAALVIPAVASATHGGDTRVSVGEAGFKGVEAIGVSRTDNPQAAAAGVKSAWLPPSLITGSNSAAAFADKEQICADNAESSRFFGNTYVCFPRYVGGPSGR